MDEPVDWEATEPLDLPDLQSVLDEQIENGVYQVQTHWVTSIAPPIRPPSEGRRHLRSAAKGLRPASAPGRRSSPEESNVAEPMDLDPMDLAETVTAPARGGPSGTRRAPRFEASPGPPQDEGTREAAGQSQRGGRRPCERAAGNPDSDPDDSDNSDS